MQYWMIKSSDDVKKVLSQVYEKAVTHDYVKPMTVHFEEYKPTRSLNQNALSHVWYRQIATHLERRGIGFDDGTPFSVEYIKSECKKMFLPTETKQRRGEEVVIPIDTSSLPIGEMYAYMQKVFVWANEIGCTLSVPEDSQFNKLREQND